MGHFSQESQPDSAFVCYRISPALSIGFVLLQMMIRKLTKSFCIFVSNLLRKDCFLVSKALPLPEYARADPCVSRTDGHDNLFFYNYYGLVSSSSSQSSLWKLTLKFSLRAGVNCSFWDSCLLLFLLNYTSLSFLLSFLVDLCFSSWNGNR